MLIQERELLGSVIKILCEDGFEAVVEKAFLECERIEKKFSRFLPDSVLSNLGSSWQEVDSETLLLLNFGLDLGRELGSSFNICVGSLLESWGYDEKYSFKPGQGQIGKIEIDGNRVRCDGKVDFGAFGKGYAVDRMVKILDEAGCRNFCVNAGGDIFARGKDWKILFEHPFDDKLAIGEVMLDGFAVASSNPNKRRWADKHHLINAMTAEPVFSVSAVYVQAASAMLADAYATGLFVAGPKSNLPVEFLIFDSNGQFMRSGGFKGELYKN